MGLGATCRTVPAGRAGIPPAPQAPGASPTSPVAIAPPVIRVGILPDVARTSIGADAGVVVRGIPVSGSHGDRQVARATFIGAGAAIRLLETGEEFPSVTLFPVRSTETLLVDATPYRGILEVRAGTPGTLTVVNILNLEDYLKGVVPNELSPTAFGELEALKAQAVAARTYALRNMGGYAAKGYDICATPACQVYRGKSTENPLSDQAVEETRGMTAAYRGQLINALYTSTCGGHTEDGGNIFDGEELPYLRGVVCAPEQIAWSTIRTTTAPASLGEDGLAREAALLVSLDVLPPGLYAATALQANASEEEVREWVTRLVAAVHRKGCEVSGEGALSHRGAFLRHVVGALCWDERAQRLLAPGDPDYLLRLEDRAELGSEAERMAAALLISEGILSPFPDNTLRPAAPLTRAQAVGILGRVAERAGAPGIVTAEFREARAGALTVDVSGTAESHPMAPNVRLFRDLDGTRVASSELSVAAGDKVRYVVQGGRVTFLEGAQSRLGTAADKTSRVYRWEVRESPTELKTALARYGDVGTVTDLLPRRLGVSGRVIEMAVTGTSGELMLKGLQVRWGLGLRENLFVVDRERDAAGAVERFIFTGKGWGHGVGLCQVGAFGMAQSGSSFDAILRHYYTGINLDKAY
jgi:stage II sporulation protein D